MAWHMLKDGWRDESSEGPYTETLQTKGDWQICRLVGEAKFTLRNDPLGVKMEFSSVELAKKHVADLEKPKVQPDKIYIAWNQAKTQGFATTDYHLAYEARKGSDSNCFDENGNRSDLAVTFCDVTGDEDCTIQTIDVEPETPADVKQLTCAVRTAATAALICDTGGDLWGEHPKYPKGDWRYEIDNNDTILGYWEWVYMKLEGEESES